MQTVSLLVTEARPMTVREIANATGVARSTASYHPKALLAINFVHAIRTTTKRHQATDDGCRPRRSHER